MSGVKNWKGPQLVRAVLKQQDKAIASACLKLERYIKLSMRNTRRGTGTFSSSLRSGKRGTKSAKYHRASYPGFPPAPDTGRLMNSITYVTSTGRQSKTSGTASGDNSVSVPPASPRATRGRVGTTVEYAAALEFGTPTIDPRPFLRPALEANKRMIIGEFKKYGLLGGLK